MRKEIIVNLYQKLNMSDQLIQNALSSIALLERVVGKDIDDILVDELPLYSDYLIDHKINTYEHIIHIARYFYYADLKDHYIHMTKYFNSHGVLESIVNHVEDIVDAKMKKQIEKDIVIPPFLTEPTDYPGLTKLFLETLKRHLDDETCHLVLANNHHQIPTSSFDDEKSFYDDSPTLEAYLKSRHERKVLELKEHYEANKIWFEQKITPEVIEYVKSNQEILSGRIEDHYLYMTKIPYDTKNYLEHEGHLKHYYACHCSFVRENLKQNQYDIPKRWCSCSAGFAKLPFETILGQSLPIEVLESPLSKDDRCRFRIDLSHIDYKR